MKTFARIFLLVVVLAALAGCAGQERFADAQALIESGQVEEGLARLEAEHKANPKDAEVRNYYLRHRALAVQRYLSLGDEARHAGQLDRAQEAYQRAQRFDPGNARAREGLAGVEKDRQVLASLAEARDALARGDDALASAKAREVLATHPQQREARSILRRVEEKVVREEASPKRLREAMQKPITMEFRDAPLRAVFELISKHTGLNFVFDKDVPGDARATVFVRDSSIEDVIRFVLVTNQLERKVLTENSILVYPNNPQKNQAYKDLVVKNFYLTNADVNKTAALVRQLVKTRDLYVDEKLNLLVIRDTPEAVRMAEKLIASQDLGEPEVVLEVEVLEVGHTLGKELGIQWPQSLGLSVIGGANIPGTITGRELQNFSGNNLRLSIPELRANFRQTDGRTNVLANPRIRVRNREKARIHIGDKVPVVTTTAGSTGFVAESVNYLDVGLKLDVEPTVHLDDDVAIKVGLEVSNIARETTTPSGTLAYQIGTRNASTTLRLKDGETQMLAGLINDEDRRTHNKVPGASRLPVVGRLFQNHNDTVNKTEVVLLITPRVVRSIERPGARLEEFNSGTEQEIGGGVGMPTAPVPSSFAPPAQPEPRPTTPTPVPAPGSTPPGSGPTPIEGPKPQ